MAETDVSAADVQEAATFLRALLLANIPDGDFTEGSPLSDFVIDGHAISFAYLRKQLKVILDRQSLRTIRNLADSQGVTDAADAILDNLFRERDAGKFARGAVTVHLSSRVDVPIPHATRFFRTRSLVYYPDADGQTLLQAADLRPNLDSSGAVVDWSGSLNVVAARVGLDYNQDSPGRFVAVDRISPFLLYAENLAPLSGGDGVQSTTDFVNKSRTAMALRAIINPRSNDATLTELFSAVTQVTTIGYGSPEMVRDVITESASGLTLHVGGFGDLYARLPVQEVVERVLLNTPTPRADQRITVFRDTVPASGDFRVAGVRPGQILVIAQGLPEAPFQFVVAAVRQDELDIVPRVPFSTATDELAVTPTFKYTIGDNYPLFDNKVNASGGVTTAATSRALAVFNAASLAGRPIYRVKQVELIGAGAALDPYRDALTGTVLFRVRANQPVFVTPRPGSPLSFRVRCLNPTEGQSLRAVTVLEVGWPALDLTGFSIEVTYDTLSGFETVASYVADPNNRPTAENSLVRGHHPVYVACTIPYRLTGFQDPFGPAPLPFSASAAVAQLARFINTYQAATPLDQSALATEARATSDLVASIYPFVVNYTLYAPTGDVYLYQTQDVVTITPDGTTTAVLLNPLDVGLPATGYFAALATRLKGLGVSDRTTRLVASPDELAFTARS